MSSIYYTKYVGRNEIRVEAKNAEKDHLTHNYWKVEFSYDIMKAFDL